MMRACAKKLPKPNAWRRDAKARTILVFEENDLQTTNVPLVCDAYLDAIKSRTDIPDETWLVSTQHDPWYAHPLLIGDAPITTTRRNSAALSAGGRTPTR
jgi:hypothetical protein